MIKAIAFLDDPVWLIIIGLLIAYIFNLRRRMAGLDNPELWLTRKERHQRALEKLKDKDDLERQIRLQKDLEFIQGTTTTHKEIA